MTLSEIIEDAIDKKGPCPCDAQACPDIHAAELRHDYFALAKAVIEECAKIADDEEKTLRWQEAGTLPRGAPLLLHMASVAGSIARHIRMLDTDKP